MTGARISFALVGRTASGAMSRESFPVSGEAVIA
jgi:hypothetical protein